MPEEEVKGPLDFKSQPHRVKGRGFRISLAERLRSARRVPQAIVKVTGFSHGLHQLMTQLSYISRKGKLPLEKDTGEIIEGLEAQEDLAKEWAIDFDSRKRSRDAASVVFSMPPGSNFEALRKATRKVGARAFPANEWLFGIHEDRGHPHAHMQVKMRGREGERKLRFRKEDLYRLREQFAEASREEGVQLACSPRVTRGVRRRGVGQVAYHLRKRNQSAKPLKESPDLTKAGVDLNPWEQDMALWHKAETESYVSSAIALRKEAQKRRGKDRDKLLAAARDLANFARTMSDSLGLPEHRKNERHDKSHLERAKSAGEKEHKEDSGLER